MAVQKNKTFKKDVIVKFVKAANMWGKFWWDDKGDQKADWFCEKPDNSRPATK